MNTHSFSARVAGQIVLAIALFAASLSAQDRPQRRIITLPTHQVTVKDLGPGVNSGAQDFAPSLLGNGRLLYFTSTREGSQDIYTAVANSSGSWEQPRALGPVINSSGDEGGASITPDGHWMVFAACDRDDSFGDCDIYIAEYLGGAWGNVANLGSTVNSPVWDSQPSISADGLMLVFASERPGGMGGADLWMSTRSLGGSWTTPANLGPTVNTTGDDLAPCIAADDQTLYFSSDMHPGAGGQDIYVTRRDGSQWRTPENMGAPINSDADDYFCGIKLGSDDIYFATARGGNLDIFVGAPNPLPPGAVTTVMGTVFDSGNKTPVAASLTVRDIQTNQPVSSFMSDAVDGSYTVVLQPGRSYVITAEAPGYLFYSDRFNVPKESMNTVVRKDVPMTRDLVRLLVYFDFDKSELNRDSYVDLDRAVAWLTRNEGVSVEIAGHTDNKGTAEYNKKLSLTRAQAVRDYLVAKGVPTARLSATGYGFEQPVDTNDTDEGRANNRRVEFRVGSH
jgi:outer membrane protein OmpA-like peptidoglycan-associated protein